MKNDKKLNYGGELMTVQIDSKPVKEVTLEEKFSDQSDIIADDSVSLYLNEMDRVPLLSREEEVGLAKRIEAGRNARKKIFDLGLKDQPGSSLKQDIEDGQRAREHLIKANVRLVVNIAKKYRRYSSSFLDLIQAGNVGLIRAVDKFDYTKGNRFSTYATWWIRRSVLRHLNQKERTIRLPNYLSTRIRKVHKIRKELMINNSSEPTMAEVGAKVNMSADEVRRLLGYARRSISLDQPIGEDGEANLQSYIENKNAPNPFTEVNQNLMSEEVIESLKVLTEREAKILTLRFGLGGSNSHTLKELGEIFGITRERIRQIQKGALKKLRHPRVRKNLGYY
jgi:RNA polymerase primary sigma factor